MPGEGCSGQPETPEHLVLGIEGTQLPVRVCVCSAAPAPRAAPAANTNKDVRLLCVGK